MTFEMTPAHGQDKAQILRSRGQLRGSKGFIDEDLFSRKPAQANYPTTVGKPTLVTVGSSPRLDWQYSSVRGVSLMDVCCHLIIKSAHILT